MITLPFPMMRYLTGPSGRASKPFMSNLCDDLRRVSHSTRLTQYFLVILMWFSCQGRLFLIYISVFLCYKNPLDVQQIPLPITSRVPIFIARHFDPRSLVELTSRVQREGSKDNKPVTIYFTSIKENTPEVPRLVEDKCSRSVLKVIDLTPSREQS